MLKRNAKNIILIIICLIMFLPMTQSVLNLFPEKDLAGVPKPQSAPGFSMNDWFAGIFQQNFDNAVNENIGFRNSLIRLKNQVDYSVFRKSNAIGVIVGKNRNIFEWDYIRAYIGRDFIGEKTIEKKISRTLFLQNELKKKGVDLILVFEPGKASFQPEDIPARYRPSSRSISNYDYMRQYSDSVGLKYLDLNQFFLQMKDTIKYPLIPRGGTHWSVYSTKLAVDTLIRYIEKYRGIDMPNMIFQKINTSKLAKDTDNDLYTIMNLIREPRKEVFAYPVIDFDKSEDHVLPRVMSIGDSFYLNILSSGILKRIFSNRLFYYYFGDVYTEKEELKRVQDYDLLEEVESQDIIMIMITERFLYKYSWGFIDQLYELLTGEIDYKNLYYYENRIRSDYKWFDNLVKSASNRGISTEEFIRDNAKYLVYQDNLKAKQGNNLETYIKRIRNDSAWLEQVRQKAINKNISLDSMLNLDARWLMDKAGLSK